MSLLSVAKLNPKDSIVLVRVDYNVPISGTKILDARRILASLPTLALLQKKGAKIVVIAHREDPNDTLAPIAAFLKRKLKNVTFLKENIEKENVRVLIDQFPSKSIIVLENIRRYEGEKKNNALFTKKLAALADVYVDDAFSVAHRAHASIVGVPQLLPHYAGLSFMKEVDALSIAPKHPFLFMLGGAKFETKVPLIEKFLTLSDQVFISGAIANSFFKVAGFEVGKSVVDDGQDATIATFLNNEKLLLPVDVMVLRDEKSLSCSLDEVQKKDIIVDIGPKTAILVIERIKKAKLIVWNGPTGWYEKGFTKATKQIARAIGESKAHAVIGGGDTGAVIEKVLQDGGKRVFISTAGGAAIDYLAKGTLPGIEALSA
jgi:phosphoglycerate kinase